MAVEIIDLVSSSPPLLDKLEGLDQPLAPHSPTPLRAANRSDRVAHTVRSSSIGRDVTSSILFDLQGCDELPDLVARGQKRRRVSASPSNQGVAASRPSFGPLDVSRQYQQRSRSILLNNVSRDVIDSIDSTNSLEMGEPHLQSKAPARASSNTGLQRPSQTAIPNSDPFLSSPIALRTLQKKDSLPRDDPDILARSSARPTRSSKVPEPTALHSDSSNPFSSSPIAKPQAAEVSANATIHSEIISRKDWDPISSSAPEQSVQKWLSPSHNREVIDLSSGADDVQDSDDEFPDIADFVVSKPRSPLQRSQSDIVASKRRKPNSAPKKPIEQRKRERDANAAAKAMKKERKQKEREQAKEAKEREKERAAALAEVNKVRTDKRVSTPEMIVLIPASLEPGLKVQVETLLGGLDVQYLDWDSPAGSTFKWRRKVKSRFDEEMGRWEPIPLQIKPEKHALTILTAQQLVEGTLNGDLDSSVERIREHFPGHAVVYMIQGMNAWIRRNRNIRNRQFASVVRQGADAASTQSQRRNRISNEEHISEDIVEDAMLRLQVEHGVLIHHTETQLDTAQWIVQFTQHISIIPYKKQRDEATASAGFCMESGQVRTGEDTQDTYVRLLQEIVRVTAPIAHGIAAEFDTVSKLVKGLERGGPSTLEGLRKSTNRDGGFSDRTIGQAVSKRIYKVFTGRDESSTDI